MSTLKAKDGARARNDEPVSADNTSPWEMIEAGRYQPRRIRGSFRGRELG